MKNNSYKYIPMYWRGLYMCLSVVSTVLSYDWCSEAVHTVVEGRYQRDVVEGHTHLGMMGYVLQYTVPR